MFKATELWGDATSRHPTKVNIHAAFKQTVEANFSQALLSAQDACAVEHPANGAVVHVQLDGNRAYTPAFNLVKTQDVGT